MRGSMSKLARSSWRLAKASSMIFKRPSRLYFTARAMAWCSVNGPFNGS